MATKITLTSYFRCSAGEALAALTDEAVLAVVMAESESLDPVIEVTRAQGRVEMHIKRAFVQDWPSLAAPIIGERLQIEEERRWQQRSEDDWQGDLHLRAVGLPIELTANLQLVSTADGSTLTTAGLIRCSVPFIGGKFEQMAMELISDAISHEAEVAQRHCS